MSEFLKNASLCISPLLTTAATTVVEAPEWVSIVCTTLTTLVVCGIKIYRLIRDRDKDLKEYEQKTDEKEGDKKNG